MSEDRKSSGETLTFHLSEIDIEFLQRYLRDHGEDSQKWRKAARKYAKEGVYNRIKAYLDSVIV